MKTGVLADCGAVIEILAKLKCGRQRLRQVIRMVLSSLQPTVLVSSRLLKSRRFDDDGREERSAPRVRNTSWFAAERQDQASLHNAVGSSIIKAGEAQWTSTVNVYLHVRGRMPPLRPKDYFRPSDRRRKYSVSQDHWLSWLDAHLWYCSKQVWGRRSREKASMSGVVTCAWE